MDRAPEQPAERQQGGCPQHCKNGPARTERGGVEERLDSPAQGRGAAMVDPDSNAPGLQVRALERYRAASRPPATSTGSVGGNAQVTRRRVHGVPGRWQWRGAAATAANLRGWWGRNTRDDHVSPDASRPAWGLCIMIVATSCREIFMDFSSVLN